MMTPEEMQKRFTYHAPKGNQAERYEQLRAGFAALALMVDAIEPDSREKATALTHLRDRDVLGQRRHRPQRGVGERSEHLQAYGCRRRAGHRQSRSRSRRRHRSASASRS